MKIIIVGGDWGNEPKPSKTVHLISEGFSGRPKSELVSSYNGGYIKDLQSLSKSKELLTYDLIIWMPNIKNEVAKIYPIKKTGAVLLISKKMRQDTTEFDAVSRIFKFGGNGVLTITENEIKRFSFKLIDALGNVWKESENIKEITDSIIDLVEWTKDSLRISMSDTNGSTTIPHLNKLIEINREIAIKCKKEFNTRFFGNLSTRCVKLFPSVKVGNELFLVSARNVDKEFLTIEDMVVVDSDFLYVGHRKPSVDTPVQISLYNKFPSINFMIHGHSYIQDAPQTKKYRPCGDVWESTEVYNTIYNNSTHPFSAKNVSKIAVNLRNHGFIFMAETIEQLEELYKESVFIPKGIEPYYR